MINTITFTCPTAGKDAGTQVKVDRIEADLKILKLQVHLRVILKISIGNLYMKLNFFSLITFIVTS